MVERTNYPILDVDSLPDRLKALAFKVSAAKPRQSQDLVGGFGSALAVFRSPQRVEVSLDYYPEVSVVLVYNQETGACLGETSYIFCEVRDAWRRWPVFRTAEEIVVVRYADCPPIGKIQYSVEVSSLTINGTEESVVAVFDQSNSTPSSVTLKMKTFRPGGYGVSSDLIKQHGPKLNGGKAIQILGLQLVNN